MGSDSFTTQNAAGGGGDKTTHTHTHRFARRETFSLSPIAPTIAHGPHNLLLSPPSPSLFLAGVSSSSHPPFSSSPVAAKTIHIEAGGQAEHVTSTTALLEWRPPGSLHHREGRTLGEKGMEISKVLGTP